MYEYYLDRYAKLSTRYIYGALAFHLAFTKSGTPGEIQFAALLDLIPE